MNRLERMTAILLLLQRQALTSDEIAQRFEVSKRTVLRDIQALSEMGVPVIAVAGPGGGYSLPEDYRLAPLALTTHEAFLLLLALSVIERLPNAPFVPERSSLQAKLYALLPDQMNVEPMLAAVRVEIPQRMKDTPFLDALVTAAHEQRWVEIHYQSVERQSRQRVLPLQITTENGYWYLRAYSMEHEEERTYRVDRMLALEPLTASYPAIRADETRPYDDPSHPEVVVRLTARGAAYAESEPHIGQSIQRLTDSYAMLRFRCPPGELAYYARFFAGMGNEAEVIAPVELQERLLEIGEQMVRRYSKR